MGIIFGILMILLGFGVFGSFISLNISNSIQEVSQAIGILVGVVIIGFGILELTISCIAEDFKSKLFKNKNEKHENKKQIAKQEKDITPEQPQDKNWIDKYTI